MKTTAHSETLPAGLGREDEVLLSRKRLAQRWDCSRMTIQRRQAAGLLHPVRFNARTLRYRLSEVIAIEKAGGNVVETPGGGL